VDERDWLPLRTVAKREAERAVSERCQSREDLFRRDDEHVRARHADVNMIESPELGEASPHALEQCALLRSHRVSSLGCSIRYQGARRWANFDGIPRRLTLERFSATRNVSAHKPSTGTEDEHALVE